MAAKASPETFKVTNDTSVYVEIDSSKQKHVDRYIKNVLKHLYLKKTTQLLNAYYAWYQSNPEKRKTGKLALFETYVRKNSEDLNETSTSAKVSPVYGDKYAIILTNFLKYASDYDKELIDIAKNMVSVVNYEDKGKLGFSKLLSDEDIRMLKGIFKLLKQDSGYVKVLETRYEKAEREENEARAARQKERVAKLMSSLPLRNRGKWVYTPGDDVEEETSNDRSVKKEVTTSSVPDNTEKNIKCKAGNNEFLETMIVRDNASTVSVDSLASEQFAPFEDTNVPEYESSNVLESSSSSRIGDLTATNQTLSIDRDAPASLTKGELIDGLESINFQFQKLFLKTQGMLKKGIS